MIPFCSSKLRRKSRGRKMRSSTNLIKNSTMKIHQIDSETKSRRRGEKKKNVTPSYVSLTLSLVTQLTWEKNCRRTGLQDHFQTFPPTSKKTYPKFPNPRKTCEYPSLCLAILIVLLLRSPCTISEPNDNPFLEKINPIRKKKGKKRQ